MGGVKYPSRSAALAVRNGRCQIGGAAGRRFELGAAAEFRCSLHWWNRMPIKRIFGGGVEKKKCAGLMKGECVES